MNSTFSRLECCSSDELIKWRGWFLTPEEETQAGQTLMIMMRWNADNSWLCCYRCLTTQQYEHLWVLSVYFYFKICVVGDHVIHYQIHHSSPVWLCADMTSHWGQSVANSLQLQADRYWRIGWVSPDPDPPAGPGPAAPENTTHTYVLHELNIKLHFIIIFDSFPKGSHDDLRGCDTPTTNLFDFKLKMKVGEFLQSWMLVIFICWLLTGVFIWIWATSNDHTSWYKCNRIIQMHIEYGPPVTTWIWAPVINKLSYCIS